MADDRPSHGARLALSALGLGFLPGAPGTAASLATAVAVLAGESWLGAGFVTAAVLGCLGGLVTLALGGRTEREGKDPSWVVTDEVAGQAIASAAAVPFAGPLPHLLAFLAFRVLDIAKPGPIRRLERFGGGRGILLDDLAAGVAAAGVVVAAGLLAPGWART